MRPWPWGSSSASSFGPAYAELWTNLPSHRHFAGNVSDNDLRTLLEDLEAYLERAEDNP